MIGSLHQVKIVARETYGCFARSMRATFKNASGALLSVLALGLACLSPTEVNAQTWTGFTPSEANGKTVYLYNVGADKFLGKGGRWGTEANLNYEGVPFTLTYTSGKITLQSLVKGYGASSNGYLTITDGMNSEHDLGNFFVDRQDKNAGSLVNCAFSSTEVTTTADNKTAYKLTVTPTFSPSSTIYNKTLYMVGTTDGTVGSLESTSDAYGQWMFVTEDERRKAFATAEAANAKPVNSTFLMYDFDFARNDNSVSYWKTGSNASSSLSYYSSDLRLPSYAQGATVTKYTHTYTSTHDAKYKSGSNVYDDATSHTASFTVTTLVPAVKMPNTITAYCGGDTKSVTSGWKTTTYTHASEEVTFTLSSTSISTSTVSAYTYYVGNGYNEGGSSSYETKDADGNKVYYRFDQISGQLHQTEDNRQATYGGNWTANIHGASGAVQQTLSSTNMVRAGYYRISCKAFTTATTGKVRLWAASGNNGNGSADEQDSNEAYAYRAITAITEAPATYVAASQLLQSEGTTYDASVKVYVENTSDLLKFGIYVDGADDNAWTCFDDFAIEYLGNPLKVLVLDEDQTDGGYIKAQATNDDDELKTVKLYLHRSLNANKWNSIVLPVDLSVGQVKSAFGDQVRISEFKGATDEAHKGRIIFEAINADRDNNSQTAIKAGKLYLIKPTVAMPTGLTSVLVPETSTSITEYYTIVGVTYAKASQVKDKDYSAKVEGEKGKETYEGDDDAIQFVGTYVKLGDDNKIPANSYVLNGNNVGGTAGLWYYRTIETASKGFRGWLQMVESTNPAKKLEYSVDGEVNTLPMPTSIQDIVDDLNAKESNIYNLNGQLVRSNATSRNGLAKGVYIQNGKKFIVK